MDFRVYINMIGDLTLVSKVYAVDTDKSAFLVADLSGYFFWVPIDQCRLDV